MPERSMTEVLFVEPDPGIFTPAARAFKRCGSLDTNHAGSAEDAIRRLSGNCADVIVSAHELPGMTAPDLLSAL